MALDCVSDASGADAPYRPRLIVAPCTDTAPSLAPGAVLPCGPGA